MKRLISLLVICTLVLVGCTAGKSSDGLEFYYDKGGESDATMEQISDNLEENGYPGYELFGYTDVASYQSVVQQSLATTDAPGVFTWWSGETMKPLVEAGYLTDLTAEWENYYIPAGVNKNLAGSLTFDGKIYGAPFNVLYTGVIYNKNIFDEYNLEIPTTFEEFEQVCDTLVENGVTPISLKDDPWASFLWFQTLVGSYDPNLYTDLVNGKVKYTDPQIYEVMTIYQEWINKGYFSEPTDTATQSKNFADGKNAMLYDADYFSIGLSQDYGLVPEEDFDIFTFPSMDENTPNAIFYEISPVLVSANSMQEEEAVEMLRGYYDKENQQLLVDNHGIRATDNTKLPNPVMEKMAKEAATDSGNVLLLRYYESEPASVVTTATDELWKFHFNPTDKQMDETLNLIQKEVDTVEERNS